MAHFAKLDENNKVVKVVVVSNKVTTPDGVNEDGQLGIDFLSNLLGDAVWKQTSYNNNFHKQFAGMGYTYNDSNNVFIVPKPFPSWTLDESHDWQPPVSRPDIKYFWDENNKAIQVVVVSNEITTPDIVHPHLHLSRPDVTYFWNESDQSWDSFPPD